MTTIELIKILQDNETGGISLKPREISLTINGRYMPNPQITLSSTGDGICGAEIDLDVCGEWLEQEPKLGHWIPVSERLPETDNKNSINKYNVLLWVKNKSHPEKEPQIYLGKLRHIDGDDGSGNFWGIKTKPCEWTIWGWCYFDEPEVIAWMPLPEPYKAESEEV